MTSLQLANYSMFVPRRRETLGRRHGHKSRVAVSAACVRKGGHENESMRIGRKETGVGRGGEESDEQTALPRRAQPSIRQHRKSQDALTPPPRWAAASDFDGRFIMSDDDLCATPRITRSQSAGDANEI